MSKTFNQADYVVYDNAGVCYIENITNVKFDTYSPERMCYILKPLYNNKSVVYIPIDNEKLTGKMRYAMSKEEIDKLISESVTESIPWNDDRRRRTEEFKKILSEKQPQVLLQLIFCIYTKKKELQTIGKKISSSDELLLQNAERFIDEEFSYSLGISLSEVSPYVVNKLKEAGATI